MNANQGRLTTRATIAVTHQGMPTTRVIHAPIVAENSMAGHSQTTRMPMTKTTTNDPTAASSAGTTSSFSRGPVEPMVPGLMRGRKRGRHAGG